MAKRRGGTTTLAGKMDARLEGTEALEKHPNLKLLPTNPVNQMELMTVDEMSNLINSIPEEQKVKRVNYFNLALMAIRSHANTKNIESMKECFAAYVALCSATGIAIGNLSAYYAVGLDKQVVDYWLKDGPGSTPERKTLVQEIRRICSSSRETMGAAGAVNPVLTIFWQKNIDGYRDQQDHVVSTENPLGDRADAQAIAEKYAGVIEMDED